MFLFSVALAATEVAAETQAADTGVAASLGLNLWQFIAQLVNFGLLIIVLRVLLYKPLVTFMEERSKKIKEGLDNAETYQEKLKALETERKLVLSKAEEEGRAKIAVSSKEADAIVADAKERATEHEAQTRQKLERAAEQYKAEALQDIRNQSAELVVLAAEKVLRQTVTKEIDKKIVEKALKEVNL